jgi:hypothetical protein
MPRLRSVLQASGPSLKGAHDKHWRGMSQNGEGPFTIASRA